MAKISPPERLRKWRGARTLRQAAADIGISAPFLLRLERGDKLPGLVLAERIEKLGGGRARDWYSARVAAAMERGR